MLIFKESCLDFFFRDEYPPFRIFHIGKAAAIYDGEIFADEIAILMSRESNNLESQLAGNENTGSST